MMNTSPNDSESPHPLEYPGAEFVKDFLHLVKKNTEPPLDMMHRYYSEKYGDSEATEDKKKRFLFVCSYINENKDALDYKNALVVGKDQLVYSWDLVFAIYARFYMSKDRGIDATTQEILDTYDYFVAIKNR